MSLKALSQHLNSNVLRGLYKYGYCVIDNALPDVLTNSILSEMKALNEFNIMYQCHTHVNTTDKTYLISKSNVWELELHSYPELQSICTDSWEILNDKSLCDLLNLNSNKDSNYKYTHQTLKMLYSSNNGCFPIHFDSDPTIDLRRITAVLYLNEQEINGGEIRLYPLLTKPINITPKYNRLVLFSSCYMLHRTLPSLQQRYALNFWLHIKECMENKININDMNALRNENPFQYVLKPKYLKCIAKLLYNNEWKQSIIDSHKEDKDIEWLLNTHKNDVQICHDVFSSLQLNDVYDNLQALVNDADDDKYLCDQRWENCYIDWMC
eukprot:349252_1